MHISIALENEYNHEDANHAARVLRALADVYAQRAAAPPFPQMIDQLSLLPPEPLGELSKPERFTGEDAADAPALVPDAREKAAKKEKTKKEHDAEKAAKKEAAKKEAAKKEAAPAETIPAVVVPAPSVLIVNVPAKPAATIDDAIDMATKMQEAGKLPQMIAVLKEMKVSRVSQLAPGAFGDFIARCQGQLS